MMVMLWILKMNKLPTIGSKWSSIDGKLFLVDNVEKIGKHTWVYYTNKDSNQKYSCYVNAFLQRFSEIINGCNIHRPRSY